MEDFFFYVGLLAGTFTTVSFIPQAYRVWKTKSANDLSMPMFILFSSGVVLWFSYGVYLNNLPIILANAVTLALCISIVWMKILFSAKPD